jgi:hypothetical protein
MAEMWGDEAYRYIMSIPPATHGQDQFYYLSDDSNPLTVEYPAIAKQL